MHSRLCPQRFRFHSLQQRSPRPRPQNWPLRPFSLWHRSSRLHTLGLISSFISLGGRTPDRQNPFIYLLTAVARAQRKRCIGTSCERYQHASSETAIRFCAPQGVCSDCEHLSGVPRGAHRETVHCMPAHEVFAVVRACSNWGACAPDLMLP